ncbi:MAG: NADH:ubiquinone reductase (Na(+)-transporting) subunit A, partial [Calditrichia bacterium]|nr:NADH:ubiquinone reductase (Na(+)-transporting) subunit A [Calditrichia bacterium]
MEQIKIKKGLQIPISGEPEQTISEGKQVEKVAIIGDDFVGMKPTMEVKVGDQVKLGQVLFIDKKTPGVKFTSPGAGEVLEINRGAKRHFESIVIKLNDINKDEDEVTFDSYSVDKLTSIEKDKIKQQLIDSGLWTSFRTRPFSKVPAPDSEPDSIFITAMDTNPLAPDVEKIW